MAIDTGTAPPKPLRRQVVAIEKSGSSGKIVALRIGPGPEGRIIVDGNLFMSLDSGALALDVIEENGQETQVHWKGSSTDGCVTTDPNDSKKDNLLWLPEVDRGGKPIN